MPLKNPNPKAHFNFPQLDKSKESTLCVPPRPPWPWRRGSLASAVPHSTSSSPPPLSMAEAALRAHRELPADGLELLH